MDREPYFFSVKLLIRHPDIDPLEISRALNLAAHHSWKVGEQRFTPIGRPLAGTHKHTSWSREWHHADEKRFFRATEKILLSLEPSQTFFSQMTKEGGETQLIISLYGRFNIGDCTTSDFLQLLERMEIRLGIEVFPEWNEAEDALARERSNQSSE